MACSKSQNISHTSRLACEHNLTNSSRSGGLGHVGLNNAAVWWPTPLGLLKTRWYIDLSQIQCVSVTHKL